MIRYWLISLLVTVGVLGCSSSSDPNGTPSAVQIVGLEDGTVEVTAGGRTIFAVAGTGPVARTFTEQAVGAGVIEFLRRDEETFPLAVESVTNDDGGVTVEYVGNDRSATLTAVVLDEEVSEFRLQFEGEANSIAVGVRCDEGGTFHGFGEQYNATNQRGEAFELYVNEQGLGRTGGGGINEGDTRPRVSATSTSGKTRTKKIMPSPFSRSLIWTARRVFLNLKSWPCTTNVEALRIFR